MKRLESVAAHLGRSFLGNEPIEAKIGVWDVEDRASAGKRAAAKALAEAERSFHKALEWEAGNPDARRGLADIYYDQFRDAEAARNEDDLDYYRELVESYHDGRYARELQGDGTLTVTTDPPGAQVFVYRYEVKQRRTIPVPWKSEAGAAARETVPAAAGLHLRPNAKDKTAHAGTAPLAGVPIPMGSYLLILRLPKYRDVRVPVRIARNQDADVRVRLYTEQEIGRGFVYVPGGEYVAGGDARVESSWERHVRNVPDFFVGRFPVTCREYLQFLNDLGSREPEEARRHAPKPPEGKELWLERAQGKWSLPTEKTPDVAWAWAPDLPVVFISWDDAVAYCAWRSKREGRRVRLPREEEREKACRGVDERWFPWGNHFDATWCNMVDSRPAGTAMLEAVGSHDVDESPYGARDLAGNVFDWCSDVFQDGKAWRALRGGAFEAGKLWSRSAARVGFLPTMRFSAAGLRVVCDPPASPGR
ncbi:MAG: SUMF1/EgtB/PvdO family nonheme iron enzyme [Acidobacteriota bacterium]